MSIKKLLGAVSPLYGAMTGEGILGKGLAELGEALGPTAGILPAMARSSREKKLREEEEAQKLKGMQPGVAGRRQKIDFADTGMRRGGKVKSMSKRSTSSASKRADGCVSKGRTKGRFV
jgi:hypothetical protein